MKALEHIKSILLTHTIYEADFNAEFIKFNVLKIKLASFFEGFSMNVVYGDGGSVF